MSLGGQNSKEEAFSRSHWAWADALGPHSQLAFVEYSGHKTMWQLVRYWSRACPPHAPSGTGLPLPGEPQLRIIAKLGGAHHSPGGLEKDV